MKNSRSRRRTAKRQPHHELAAFPHDARDFNAGPVQAGEAGQVVLDPRGRRRRGPGRGVIRRVGLPGQFHFDQDQLAQRGQIERGVRGREECLDRSR